MTTKTNTDVGIVAAVFASHSWVAGDRRAWDLDRGRRLIGSGLDWTSPGAHAARIVQRPGGRRQRQPARTVEGCLVPAGMQALGRAAWWAPRPLRRLHDRVGLREAPGAQPIVDGTADLALVAWDAQTVRIGTRRLKRWKQPD